MSNSTTGHSLGLGHPSETLPYEVGPQLSPGGAIPLSFAQQRLWFLDQLEPNSPLYNVPLALRLSGCLNGSALELALERIAVRHEALRTRFGMESGGAVQVVSAEARLAWTQVDLSPSPFSLREAELAKRIQAEARRPFCLRSDHLCRATLFRVAETEHVLLLVLHHTICDEWSLRVLMRELSTFYAGFLRGEEVTLPELPVQYGDYAIWQREILAGPLLDSHLDYWKGRLGGEFPRLELPTTLRGSEPRFAGRQEKFALPEAVAQRLVELARSQGVTLFTLLLTSFKVLLVHYTRQTDIAVGSPVAGRTQVEVENLIGFFVNTVVLRTDLSGNPTFLQALQRVKDVTLGAYEHQDLPFDRLVQELHPQRDAERSPFLQVVFALEHVADDELRLPGLVSRSLDVDTGTAKFDLTWAVREHHGSLTMCVEYAARKFAPWTIRQMLTHWQTLLEGVVAAPSQPIGQIGVLTPQERRQLLLEWNQTQRPYPADKTLAELFEAQVRQRPQHLAVRYEGTALSYAELDRRATDCARGLRGLGITRNGLVAVCLERSVDLVVAWVAIIKAGAAYVPLDPSYPKDRLRVMLEDSAASVVLVQEHLRDLIPPTQARVSTLPDLATAPPSLSDHPEPAATPDNVAYVIYTSGSTGRPKGVLVHQRAVVRLVCQTDYVQLTPQDRVAQVSNVAFDAATFEIWGALLNGATIVGFEREITLSPRDFAKHLAGEGVTTLFVTTALFNQLAAEVPEALAPLKHVLFGGEAVDPKWVRAVLERHPPGRLLHVYGPTETTTFASWHLVRSVSPDAATIPIGRPIANTSIYLLDPWMEPVPVGVCGEIYVGGPGVALGYLNSPGLTAERFVPDPFSPDRSARLYRTGDLGRFRADGAIEFVRRADQQVKIRGFRVEPGEIETLVATYPGVREVVVIAVDGAAEEGKKLVGYVVPTGGSEADLLAGIRSYVKGRLPSYMHPSAWVCLPSLPLTKNGKVDRQALPSPDQCRTELNSGYCAPRTETERRLAAVWSRVLGVSKVGVHDGFFDLGGHSLLAVRLFSEIEKEFGLKLPLASLFQQPTVEALAGLLMRPAENNLWPLLVPIQAGGSKLPIYWIHSLGGDGGGAFFYYRKLAQLLGPDQPSFGIRSPQEPFTDVAQMAAHYVQELMAAQPEGPYFLGGYCFGGVVAFEMARQLREQRREVGLLALLESAPPGVASRRLRPRCIAPFLSNFFYWLLDWSQQSPKEWSGRLRRKFRLLLRQRRLAKDQHEQVPRNDLGELLDMTEYPKDYVRYAQAHWQALQKYRARPYPGCVTLFRARKQPLWSCDPTLGWDRVAKGGVVLRVIPGTHEKMIVEPNVSILAAQLKSLLIAAQSGQRSVHDPSRLAESKTGGALARYPCSMNT